MRTSNASQIELEGAKNELRLDPGKNFLQDESLKGCTIPSLSPSLFVPARFDGVELPAVALIEGTWSVHASSAGIPRH
jgi:hypothetical protein